MILDATGDIGAKTRIVALTQREKIHIGNFVYDAKKRRRATALRFVGDLSAIRRWVSLGLARLVVATTMVTVTLAALRERCGLP